MDSELKGLLYFFGGLSATIGLIGWGISCDSKKDKNNEMVGLARSGNPQGIEYVLADSSLIRKNEDLNEVLHNYLDNNDYFENAHALRVEGKLWSVTQNEILMGDNSFLYHFVHVKTSDNKQLTLLSINHQDLAERTNVAVTYTPIPNGEISLYSIINLYFGDSNQSGKVLNGLKTIKADGIITEDGVKYHG